MGIFFYFLPLHVNVEFVCVNGSQSQLPSRGILTHISEATCNRHTNFYNTYTHRHK